LLVLAGLLAARNGVGEISGTVAVTDFSLILSDNVTEGLA